MKQVSDSKWLIAATVLVFSVTGVSASGEERPDLRTAQADLRMDVRAPDVIEGVVADVTRDGDDVFLRTGGQTIRIEAHGGIKAWYQGRAYRVRDLERGDLIRVDLDDHQGNRYRARSIEVLRSISHDGPYQGRDRYDDRYDRDRRYDRDTRRDVSVEGRVARIDRRYDEMVLRIDARRELIVDLRRLDGRGRHSPMHKVKVGDVVRVEGRLDRGVLVARDVDELHGRDRRY